MFILDSSAIIDFFRGNEKVTRIIEGGNSATTVFSYYEVMRPLLENKGRQYAFFWFYFKKARVFDFDMKACEESAEIFSKLSSLGTPINHVDAMIAGICRSRKGKIVTKDRDFMKLDKIGVECILV